MRRRERFAGRGMLAIRADALVTDFDCPECGAEMFERCEGVAVVKVGFGGPLTQHAAFVWDNYDAIKARCAAAFADASTHAVLLDVDSPGGDVSGVFELAAELRAMASVSPKRFVAFTDNMAASAAYAIATSAQEIYVTSTGQLGSVGVINALVDVTALDKAQGIKFSIISSGERKKDFNPHVAITDSAEIELRSKVNDLAAIFFAWVNRTRPKLTGETLQSFDGALFTGTEAVKVGLANGVTTKTELLASLARASAASAAATSEATMADGDKDQKSYEEEMRAKLEEDSKSDDEKKAAAAKKMLAALDGEKSDDDKKKEKEEADAKAKAAEEEKQKEEAKASAVALSQIGKDAQRIAALEAKLEVKERADIYAAASAERVKIGGPGAQLSAAQVAYLDALPLDKVKAALAAFPPPPADPASVARVKPTVGEGRGNSRASQLPPEEAEQMRQRMGLTSPKVAIRHEGHDLVFPAMTRDEAKAAEKSAREGGV